MPGHGELPGLGHCCAGRPCQRVGWELGSCPMPWHTSIQSLRLDAVSGWLVASQNFWGNKLMVLCLSFPPWKSWLCAFLGFPSCLSN